MFVVNYKYDPSKQIPKSNSVSIGNMFWKSMNENEKKIELIWTICH